MAYRGQTVRAESILLSVTGTWSQLGTSRGNGRLIYPTGKDRASRANRLSTDAIP
jgi:hypothetical protein